MVVKKGVLKAWYSATFTANVQISGSSKAFLQGIKVARNMAPAEMIPGRNVAVIFWDKSNAADAVVVAVY